MRRHWRRFVHASCVALLVGTIPGAVDAAELKAETMRAWATYVEATERRMAGELEAGEGFLVLDFQPASRTAKERRDLTAGKIVVSEMESRDRHGKKIAVPSGAIHHWRGSVFIPGVTLEEVLAGVRQPAQQHELQEDVLESRILEQGPDTIKLFLKLKRKNIVTVVYNTEHEVRYQRQSDTRASSTSRATKIAEVMEPGSSQEREKPEGHDRGFLWRLTSYWRYEQVDGGVIAECESVSLSRGIPGVLKLFVGGVINGVARGSMERMLEGMRERLGRVDTIPTIVVDAS